MNPVISREYVEKNYIEKSELEKYIDKKIDNLSKVHNNSKNNIEREIAKGMAVFATMMKNEILEGIKK